MGGREEEGVRVVPLQQPDVLQDEFRRILWLLQQVEDVPHFQQLQLPEEGACSCIYTHANTKTHTHKHTHTIYTAHTYLVHYMLSLIHTPPSPFPDIH